MPKQKGEKQQSQTLIKNPSKLGTLNSPGQQIISNVAIQAQIMKSATNVKSNNNTVKLPSSLTSGSKFGNVLQRNKKNSKVVKKEIHIQPGELQHQQTNLAQIKLPQSTRAQTNNFNFFSHDQDHVQDVNTNMRINTDNGQQSDHEKITPTKRMSMHNKRGRNQPSQFTQTNTHQQQNVHRVPLLQEEIFLVNLSKKNSFYGNDDDIYEMERLGDVMLINQVKLEQSSMKEDEDLSSMLRRQSNPLHKQQSFKDLRLPLLHMQPTFQTPIEEQEIDENLSRIDPNQHQLFKQRSLSLSHQSSYYQVKGGQLRPESGSLMKSISSSNGKILRRESSTGQLFESPSERTILDVLGICPFSTSTNKQGNRESLPLSYGGGPAYQNIQLGQFNEDAVPYFENNTGGGNQVFLFQQNYQYLEYPSKINSLNFMNQSSSSQNAQILFNIQPGCNGSQTDNSYSTNKMVNNFLEEKRKELEALQEVDRESDTTEQMTFSNQDSKSEQEASNKGQKVKDQVEKDKQLLIELQEQINLEDQEEEKEDRARVDDQDCEIEENKQQLKRANVFDYQKLDKKGIKEKKKHQERAYVQRGSVTSNPKMISIRDILSERDSRSSQLPLYSQQVDSSSLVEVALVAPLLSPPHLGQSQKQKSSRIYQSKPPLDQDQVQSNASKALRSRNNHQSLFSSTQQHKAFNSGSNKSNGQQQQLNQNRTTKNLVIDQSKNFLAYQSSSSIVVPEANSLEDGLSASQIDIPDDIGITLPVRKEVHGLKNQQAGNIKCFDFRPSKIN